MMLQLKTCQAPHLPALPFQRHFQQKGVERSVPTRGRGAIQSRKFPLRSRGEGTGEDGHAPAAQRQNLRRRRQEARGDGERGQTDDGPRPVQIQESEDVLQPNRAVQTETEGEQTRSPTRRPLALESQHLGNRSRRDCGGDRGPASELPQADIDNNNSASAITGLRLGADLSRLWHGRFQDASDRSHACRPHEG